MALFKRCAVILDGEKEVYRKGETVTGSLLLDVRRSVTVKRVRVYLCGATLTQWYGFLSPRKDSEKYFELFCTVFGSRGNDTGPNHTLTAGQHDYRFKFNLPKKSLPSSFEGHYGAIRYWVQVEIVMTFPHVNQWRYHGITILDDINVNYSQYKASVQNEVLKPVPKSLGSGDSGSLTLTAATDRGAYCAGEKVALKVVVKNDSTRNLGKLKAQLEQKVVYKAKTDFSESKTNTKHTVIRTLEGTPVMKGEDKVWKDQLLVDFIPPSTKATSCHILAVSYFIRVLVEVFLGHNIEITLPITIGTIPYGHAPAAGEGEAGGAAAGTEISAYTKCNRGFYSCIEDDEFSNFKYVPMCAYVVNNTL